MRVAFPVKQVAVFDLDGTLTWRDSFVQFLSGYLNRQPLRWARSWQVLPAFAAYLLGGRDRGLLKQRLIQTYLRGEPRAAVDAWAVAFAARLMHEGMRREGVAVLQQHQQQGDYVVLLSASPDLYVPRVGEQLRVDRVICTQVRYANDRVDGRLLSANRRGEEKLRVLEALRAEFPGARFAAYGNAASDLAHLARTDAPLLVNAGPAARRRAAQLRIATASWA
jgi:phosphatidylglycerophosphatase C